MHRRTFIAAALVTSATPALAWRQAGLARIQLINDKVHLVDAQLLGEPVRAIVDTGARVSTVSESLATKLGIAGSGSRRVNTVHGEFRVRMARDLPLEVSGLAYRAARWAIMPDAFQPGIDCVLDTTALGDFSLAFSDQTLAYGLRAAHEAGLRMRRSAVPVAEFSVGSEELPMVLDTGADVAWVNPDVARKLLGQAGVTASWFTTADGPQLRAIRLPSLTCGDVQFSDVLLRVRADNRNLKVSGRAVAGLFGANAMRFYDWSFGAGYRTVSRSSALPGRMEWMGLGVDYRVDAQDPGRVVGLAVNGPAAQAGLSIGDRILTLDGVTADPAGDAVMLAAGNCRCVETVAVQFLRAGESVVETVSIVSAPMV